jgi:hypothetical protein
MPEVRIKLDKTLENKLFKYFLLLNDVLRNIALNSVTHMWPHQWGLGLSKKLRCLNVKVLAQVRKFEVLKLC